MKKSNKITILGAGNVGSSIAYACSLSGVVSEIVIIDINEDKAKGEALDICQGSLFSPPTNIYAGNYADAKNSDVVIITVGVPRRENQSRMDLVKTNTNILRDVMGKITPYAFNAVYVIVSNPVDILTYVASKEFDIPNHKIIGSGTLLDSSRLCSIIGGEMCINPKDIHAYVLGEHGDTSFVPWSLTDIAGTPISRLIEDNTNYSKEYFEEEVRNAGSNVIALKGATNYSIATSVSYLVQNILLDTGRLLTVSSMLDGQYGISDVCLSINFKIGMNGIEESFLPPLNDDEQEALENSANSLKEIINNLYK